MNNFELQPLSSSGLAQLEPDEIEVHIVQTVKIYEKYVVVHKIIKFIVMQKQVIMTDN
jgi:hypothetical protein